MERRAVPLILVLGLVGACHAATGPAGLPTAACANAVNSAVGAQAGLIDGPRLDPVLRACTSIPDLAAAASAHVGAFAHGDPVFVATTRCREPDAPATTDLCVRLLNGDYSDPR